MTGNNHMVQGCCFNNYIHHFELLCPHTVGNCVSLLQGFWDCKSGIKYPSSRVSFLACVLPCTSPSHGRLSCHLACLHSLILCAYGKFEPTEVISKTLFWRNAFVTQLSLGVLNLIKLWKKNTKLILVLVVNNIIVPNGLFVLAGWLLLSGLFILFCLDVLTDPMI